MILYIFNFTLDDITSIEPKSDFEAMQRLEAVLIRWTRQIREVVNAKESVSIDGGPLIEIEFWKSRCVDLNGILLQLDRSGAIQLMELVKDSSYLGDLKSLISLMSKRREEASRILEMLSIINEPCVALSNATPKQIPAILKRIVMITRMLCFSEFYSKSENATALLRRVSNQVITQVF